MKFFRITIRPESDFGTPLKGDTLFGHFCWQVAHDSTLVEEGLEKALADYGERPFAVFSSAFPMVRSNEETPYALPRPTVPMSWLFPDQEDIGKSVEMRKKQKKKRWMLVAPDLGLDFAPERFVNDDALAVKVDTKRSALREKPALVRKVDRPHNTINRATNTTGTGMFAPYSMPALSWLPGLELAIFAALDPEATDIDRVSEGLRRIGLFGFGRDASTGLGRFSVVECGPIDWPAGKGANAVYTLGPCVPAEGDFTEPFFTPFVRYGRHGDAAATSGAPFKAPVVMADEGAVFVRGENDGPMPKIVGRAVTGVSRLHENAVHQGYAPCLPLTLEVQP